MDTKPSTLQRVNVTLILILAGLAWSGCGWSRPVSLPNGYICYVDDWIWIEHPDFESNTLSDVGKLDVHGDIVIGTQLDRDTNREVGYFTLNTSTHGLYVTASFEEFAAAVADRGIEEMKLRWPGRNFNGPRPFRILVYTLIATVVFGVFVLFIRSVARHEAVIRRNRLDRL